MSFLSSFFFKKKTHCCPLVSLSLGQPNEVKRKERELRMISIYSEMVFLNQNLLKGELIGSSFKSFPLQNLIKGNFPCIFPKVV